MPICLIYFLRERVDIFEKESWGDILSIFVISCASTIIFAELLPIRDLYFPSVNTNNTTFFDMLIGVAFLEEIVKIIPVIVFIIITKSINEPIDYLIYASVSALGFAFIENIGYIVNYSQTGIHIVGIRSFFPTTMHIFTTSIIGVAIFNKKEKKSNVFIPFIGAVLIHTCYNYFISTPVLPYIILVMLGVFYAESIKKLLKKSPYWNPIKITNKVDDLNFGDYRPGSFRKNLPKYLLEKGYNSQMKIQLNTTNLNNVDHELGSDSYHEQLIEIITENNVKDKIKYKYLIPESNPTSYNTKYVLYMLIGVLIIDAIFELINTGTYNLALLDFYLIFMIYLIFMSFFTGPLNTNDLDEIKIKQK
tara:strand:- start:9861 stop:10949 length:1089 start_codon:yes stop_codon:yes gene_type:complete